MKEEFVNDALSLKNNNMTITEWESLATSLIKKYPNTTTWFNFWFRENVAKAFFPACKHYAMNKHMSMKAFSTLAIQTIDRKD